MKARETPGPFCFYGFGVAGPAEDLKNSCIEGAPTDSPSVTGSPKRSSISLSALSCWKKVLETYPGFTSGETTMNGMCPPPFSKSLSKDSSQVISSRVLCAANVGLLMMGSSVCCSQVSPSAILSSLVQVLGTPLEQSCML